MADYVLSAFSDEYADSLEEQLTALQQFGIRYMELRHVNRKNVSVLSPDEVKEIKKRMDVHGIRTSAIGSPLGKIPLDGDLEDHLECARRIFEYANLLGTPLVRIFSFYAPKGACIADCKSKVLFSLERMILLARTFGVTLCHENEARIYGDTPLRCRELLDHFDGELRCVFDMGNFVLEGVDPLSAYETLKKDVVYFHIKDALYEGAIVPAGRGEAKILSILSAHMEYAKEDFFVSLEPHLQLSSGINALVGRAFTNPYRYEDKKAAFSDAVSKFKELF